MKKSMKSFFKMAKYETIKVLRNKVVMTLLLTFSIVFIVFLSTINLYTDDFTIAIYTDNQDINEIQCLDMLTTKFDKDKFKYVSSIEEGDELIVLGKVPFFIVVNADEEPMRVDVHYDASAKGVVIYKDILDADKDTYAYKMVTDYLEEYGIKINENYFNLVEFTSVNNVTAKQLPYSVEFSVAIALTLMLGLAYSMSKDNETNVAKNTLYMPIGLHKYLWSKVVPYILLGVVESTVLVILGRLLFGITPVINPIVLILFTLLFIMASIMLGLVCANFKNQISTVFCSIGTILIPEFILVSTFAGALPLYVKIFLYLTPIGAFDMLFNTMLYSGVIAWANVLYLILQIIFYYVVAWLILKKRTRN